MLFLDMFYHKLESLILKDAMCALLWHTTGFETALCLSDEINENMELCS